MGVLCSPCFETHRFAMLLSMRLKEDIAERVDYFGAIASRTRATVSAGVL